MDNVDTRIMFDVTIEHEWQYLVKRLILAHSEHEVRRILWFQGVSDAQIIKVEAHNEEHEH